MSRQTLMKRTKYILFYFARLLYKSRTLKALRMGLLLKFSEHIRRPCPHIHSLLRNLCLTSSSYLRVSPNQQYLIANCCDYPSFHFTCLFQTNLFRGTWPLLNGQLNFWWDRNITYN